jgi:hypothetical protein
LRYGSKQSKCVCFDNSVGIDQRNQVPFTVCNAYVASFGKSRITPWPNHLNPVPAFELGDDCF